MFVEEITRSVLASGALEERDGQYHLKDAGASFVIPATLQDSLVARLDRLGPAKDVALAASIIGQEFSFELVEALVSLESHVAGGCPGTARPNPTWSRSAVSRRTQSTASSMRSSGTPPIKPS